MKEELLKKRIGFQIFFRRPLALVCAVFLALSVVGFLCCLAVKCVAAIILALGIMGFALACAANKISKRRFLGIATTFAAGLVALLLSFLYFDCYYENVQKYTDKKCEIVGVVEERLYSGTYFEGYAINLKYINGEKVRYKAIFECEYVSDLQVGYEFSAVVNAEDAGESATNVSDRLSQMADGYAIRFVSESEDEYNILQEDVFTVDIMLSAINRKISSVLTRLIGGEEGKLSAALFMGRKDKLDITTYRDFLRSGVSHILALSGMHMAVIMGFFSAILTKFRVNRFIRSIILILLSFAYLAITGFSTSATRSVIMLTIVYLSYMFASSPDTPTSLFAAVTVIVLLSPRSVADVGLWLSFSAVLGIIIASMGMEAFYNKIDRRRRERSVNSSSPVGPFRRIWRGFLNAIIISVAANIGVVFIVWLCFGETSVFSIPASVVMSPFATIALAGSLGVTLLSLLEVNAAILNIFIIPCRISTRIMLIISEYFSNFDGAVISLKHTYSAIIITSMTVVLVIMIIVKLKHKWTIIIPPTSAIIAFVICASMFNAANEGVSHMTYLRDGTNETILITSGYDGVIVDISRGGVSGVRMALENAAEHGVCELDAFVLTHYHQKHISTVYKICSSEHVGEVWLPMPINETEYGIMMSIISCAKSLDTACVIYDGELNLFNDMTIDISRNYIKRSTHPTIMMKINYPNKDIVYVGKSSMESALVSDIDEFVKCSEGIILGAHGPILKQQYNFSAYGNDLDFILFADDEVISYYRYEEHQNLLQKTLLLRGSEKYEIVFGAK